jgi:hypothetical protein
MKFNEQLIKEKRTIEATKKEYLGGNGKFVLISRNLGEEIIHQGSNNDYIKYDNFWENEDKTYDIIDENTPISSLGFYFYGLNYSCNLEIYSLEHEKLTKVTYNGEKVYEEVNGELQAYSPSQDWENLVEDLYKLAKEKDKLAKEKEKDKKKQIFEKQKIGLIENLRRVWGV